MDEASMKEGSWELPWRACYLRSTTTIHTSFQSILRSSSGMSWVTRVGVLIPRTNNTGRISAYKNTDRTSPYRSTWLVSWNQAVPAEWLIKMCDGIGSGRGRCLWVVHQGTSSFSLFWGQIILNERQSRNVNEPIGERPSSIQSMVSFSRRIFQTKTSLRPWSSPIFAKRSPLFSRIRFPPPSLPRSAHLPTCPLAHTA